MQAVSSSSAWVARSRFGRSAGQRGVTDAEPLEESVPYFSDVLDILLVLVAIGALILVLIDRGSREKAWRDIAEERRWNHDARTGGPLQDG